MHLFQYLFQGLIRLRLPILLFKHARQTRENASYPAVGSIATKPTIPYFAPPGELPAPLPTFEEVLAGEDFISHELQTSIVRVREHFAVKYERRTSVQEGLNMFFVAQSTSIPAPEVYAIYEQVHKGVKCCVIVMEYIAGKTLLSRWRSLSMDQKRETAVTLRGYMDELRSLPSRSYYGSL